MQINTYNLELASELRSLIEEEHMYLYRFNIFILLLQCDIEKLQTTKRCYQVSLTLYLEKKTYTVVSQDRELTNAIEEAFVQLQNKLFRHETKLTLGYIKQKLGQIKMVLNSPITTS